MTSVTSYSVTSYTSYVDNTLTSLKAVLQSQPLDSAPFPAVPFLENTQTFFKKLKEKLTGVSTNFTTTTAPNEFVQNFSFFAYPQQQPSKKMSHSPLKNKVLKKNHQLTIQGMKFKDYQEALRNTNTPKPIPTSFLPPQRYFIYQASSFLDLELSPRKPRKSPIRRRKIDASSPLSKSLTLRPTSIYPKILTAFLATAFLVTLFVLEVLPTINWITSFI